MSFSFVKEKLKSATYEVIQFEGIQDVCTLPENRFLSSRKGALTIYDENFVALKKVEKIDDKKIDCYGVVLNKNNIIYASDYKNSCVYMMDLDLVKLKTFGSKGNDKTKLDGPIGVACTDELLYVSDCANRRIQIFNFDLAYVGTIMLNFCPQTIRISNSTLGVLGYDKSLNFYDLKTKKLKKQYSGDLGRICEVESNFYVVSSNPLKAYCFDTDGFLIEEVGLEKYRVILSHVSGWDGNLFMFNNNLFMTVYTMKQVLKF